MASRKPPLMIADLARNRLPSEPLTPEERAAADVLAAEDLASAALPIAEYVRAHAALLNELTETAQGRDRVRAVLRQAEGLVQRARGPDADRIRAGTMEKYSPSRGGRSL